MASLRKQLRAQQAQTTTARGREVELRLTNEGLMEEITRWKRQAHQEATAAQEALAGEFAAQMRAIQVQRRASTRRWQKGAAQQQARTRCGRRRAGEPGAVPRRWGTH